MSSTVYPWVILVAFHFAGYLTSQKFSGDMAEVEILRNGEQMTLQIE